MKQTIFLFLLFLNPLIHAQTIPAERKTDWSQAGCDSSFSEPETIIDVTEYGAMGDSLSDCSPIYEEILSQLNNQGGIIYFPEGVYRFTSTLNIPSNTIIRGESSEKTSFVFDLEGRAEHCIKISSLENNIYYPVPGNLKTGDSIVRINDPEIFTDNSIAELQQQNGSWDTNPISWAEHSVGQIIHIQSVFDDSLVLAHPLRIDFDSSLLPEIRKVVPVQNAGIEYLKITRTDNVTDGVGYNIYISSASNCRIRSIESFMSVGSHIYLTGSTNTEITGCYIHHAFDYDGSGTRGYGVTLNRHTGECLVENNIFNHLRHAMMVKTGANGNVFGYNYSTQPFRTEPIADLAADISLHGHYPFANLFEGNIVQNIMIDHYWGPSGPDNTFFRNRAEKYGIFMDFPDTTLTSGLNIAGNEVTNKLYGTYYIAGENHFEYGNYIKNTLSPSGTGEPDNFSCYLNNPPSFWNITDPWPSIGLYGSWNKYSIPAKERFLSGKILTQTIHTNLTGTDKYPDNSPKIKVRPNPCQGILYIDGISQFSKISVYTLSGQKVFSNNNHRNPIIFPPSLKNGIYFIRFISQNTTYTRKILLTRN